MSEVQFLSPRFFLAGSCRPWLENQASSCCEELNCVLPIRSQGFIKFLGVSRYGFVIGFAEKKEKAVASLNFI